MYICDLELQTNPYIYAITLLSLLEGHCMCNLSDNIIHHDRYTITLLAVQTVLGECSVAYYDVNQRTAASIPRCAIGSRRHTGSATEFCSWFHTCA